MEQTNAKIKQYKEGDYLVTIIETDNDYSAWLEHQMYGVSAEMFEIAKQAPGLPAVTEEDFLQMVKNELPKNISAYREEYMDETDLLFETGRETSEVQECEFDENNTGTQRIVSPYGHDRGMRPLITMIGTLEKPLLQLDGDKVLVANFSVYGDDEGVGHIKVARAGFESYIDLIRGLACAPHQQLWRSGETTAKTGKKRKIF